MATRALSLPTAADLRRRFDASGGMTVGVEEEAMLLDPATFDLAPVADAVLARLDAAAHGRRELPAAQLEVGTAPAPSATVATARLAAARAAVTAAADGLARPAAAGVHPFAAVEGALTDDVRYDGLRREYGAIARRQLVAALQVHVAVGGADRTLAVSNALRDHLPELAALAANAPFHGGRDTGLASVRPLLAGQLPRQGIPPPLADWEQLAAELRWGARAGAVPEARLWWWELRPHPTFGTLELRVPDAQTTVRDAGAVIAVAHALVATLADRYDRGAPLPSATPTWRIAENRWSALRHGLDGTMADLVTGEVTPTRERVAALLRAIAPAAARLDGGPGLAAAQALLADGGAARQRAVTRERGLRGLAAWLAERYPP